MNQDTLKFQIDQLRKDKIIYGVEAGATAVTCLLILIFSNTYFQGIFRDLINTGVLIISIGYTTYMGIGNARRLARVKKLEKTLNNK